MYEQGRLWSDAVLDGDVACCVVDLRRSPSHDIEEVLRRLGFSVSETWSVDRSLTDLRSLMPELVVIVLDTIGADHMALVRLVRRSTNALLFVLSRLSTPQMRIDVLEAGADEYAQTDVGADELAARIQAKLRRLHAPPRPV